MIASAAAYSALCQWILKVSNVPLAEGAIVGRRGCEPSRAAALLSELDRIRSDFSVRSNRLGRNDGKLAEAYASLKVHPLSAWETSEIEVQEGIASGRFSDWTLAGGPHSKNGPTDQNLWLLVVHGGIEFARPLLLRWAEEHSGDPTAVWARWIATGTLDSVEARNVAGDPATLDKLRPDTHVRLPLFFIEKDEARAHAALERVATPKERELSDKPVKTLPKLLMQLTAHWRGAIDASVLRKSFRNWFGYCYHKESPSNLPEKVGPAFLYSRYLEDQAPHDLLASFKGDLPMFSPKRCKARAQFVAGVGPVMETLNAIVDQLAKGDGLVVSPFGVLGPWSA